MWVGCFTSNIFSFITPEVYNTEDSNLLYWKEELLGKPVMSKSCFVRCGKTTYKASVCSAYTTGNHAKQTVFSYYVSRAVATSFPHTKLDTTLVCLSLRLVYQTNQRETTQFQLWEAIFFLTSRIKNALN